MNASVWREVSLKLSDLVVRLVASFVVEKHTMASIVDYVTILIDRIPKLQETGMALSSALHEVAHRNPQVRRAVDVLHGKQAGHPIHPILTDITLGAWLLGSAFDIASLVRPSNRTRHTADNLIAIGTVSAVPTMLTGMADYSGLPQEAIKVGTLHALFNVAGLTLYGLSILSRRNGAREWGVGLSLAGMGVMVASGYLGGDLVYRLQVGVNRNLPEIREEGESEKWVPVLPVDELPEYEAKRVDVEGQPVALYRRGGAIYAIGAVCSHDGGPLEKGIFDGQCVECLWHHSVFDLTDGSVVHGPAVFSQPVYRVRIRDSHIEVCDTPERAGQSAEPVRPLAPANS